MIQENSSENTVDLSLLAFSARKSVPIILQSEVAECGLASLAMIASYYGHKINLAALRKKILISSQGMTLRQIMEVAGGLNFSCRAIQCPLEDINQLTYPCLLHWNMEHFVVLTGVSNNAFYINDPALGKRKLNSAQFSEAYTGIALELTPTTAFKKRDQRVVMRINQLWEKIAGLKRSLVSLFAVSLVIQTAALVSPYYMQLTIDNVLLSNDKPLLVVLAIGFAMLTLIQTGIGAFRSWLVLRLSSTLNLQLGANLFHHLLRLPMSYFEKRHIGDVVSRFDSLTSIREMLTNRLVESIIDGLMAITVLAMMFLYSSMLSAVVIVIVLLSLSIRIAFFFPSRRLSEELIIAGAKEDSTFLESIRAIQTIKLFSYETARQNTWLNYYAEVINTNLRLGKLTIAETTLNNVVFGLETIIVVYLGALTVIDGDLTTGMLIAFIAYKNHFTSSTSTFIENLLAFKLLGLHLQRLSDITLNDKEGTEEQKMTLPDEVVGRITVENLSFRYSDNTDWVIKDLSFEIEPGESVAITGESGSGKTTLLKIILGLLKPDSGKIYLDGVDMNELSLRDYRSHFGAVMQNDTLLSGTLVDNITLFDSKFDEQKLIKCCQDACIWDQIKTLPMNIYSLVGDMGSSFSGGQLQRVFLARALYKEPKILCLDESTSHLDQLNEDWINKNIRKINMTKIVIAHRKETISYSDRIISI
jgi:ATP-binding cassette, subfamily B, bacterial CvaB/MchF/RaxB